MPTTTRTGRYRPPDVRRRAGLARSAVGQQRALAGAMKRSEALVSELCGASARRKGALGRTLEIIWHVNRVQGLSAAPLVREILVVDRESKVQLDPLRIAERFRDKKYREHLQEGRENLGTSLLDVGDIGLREWLGYVLPELDLTLGMVSLAEFMIDNEIDWRMGL